MPIFLSISKLIACIFTKLLLHFEWSICLSCKPLPPIYITPFSLRIPINATDKEIAYFCEGREHRRRAYVCAGAFQFYTSPLIITDFLSFQHTPWTTCLASVYKSVVTAYMINWVGSLIAMIEENQC